jgi:hypothetical protein
VNGANKAAEVDGAVKRSTVPQSSSQKPTKSLRYKSINPERHLWGHGRMELGRNKFHHFRRGPLLTRNPTTLLQTPQLLIFRKATQHV